MNNKELIIIALAIIVAGCIIGGCVYVGLTDNASVDKNISNNTTNTTNNITKNTTNTTDTVDTQQQTTQKASQQKQLTDEEFNELANRNPNPKYQGDYGDSVSPSERQAINNYLAQHDGPNGRN